MDSVDKKKNRLKAVFVLLASFTCIVGLNIQKTKHFWGDTEQNVLITCLHVILLTLAFLVADYFRIKSKLLLSYRDDQERNFNYKKYSFLLIAVHIVILIAYYPGISNFDTGMQIGDFLDGTTTFVYHEGGKAHITAFLNDHHPVLTTFIFSFFILIGRALGSERLGFFIYTVLQCGLFVYAYVFVLRLFDRSKNGTIQLIAGFYVLNRLLAYFAITMLKDSLFSALFLIYCVLYIKFVNKQRVSTGEKDIIAWIILSILLPLCKKTGIYVVLFSNTVLLVQDVATHASKKDLITKAGGLLLPAVLMFFVLPKIIFPACNIYPGGKQEVLATLFQQTVRTAIDHPEAYSEEERVVLNRVIDFDSATERYDYDLTDPIKNTYKLETVTQDDLSAYYKIWLRTGLKFPVSYLEATIGTCGGYFSPTVKLNPYKFNVAYEMTPKAPLVFLRKMIMSFYDLISLIPGINLMRYIVFYSWWLPLIGLYLSISKKGWKGVIGHAPFIITVLILIVCPYSTSRYALPLVIATPVILFESYV